MADSPKLIQPLDSEEIKSGIVTKVCEALFDSLNKTCDLYGPSYPKFKASGTIEITLDREPGAAPDPSPIVNIIRIDIPFTPPDAFRKQTGQGVPTIVAMDDGSVEQKAVFYRRERTSRIGRADYDTDD